jgi:hypothetical protein
LTSSTGWRRSFDDPIPLPRGRELVTLKDAGTYITKLPKAEHEAPEWQAAMEALILVATKGGPTMLARIGMMRALNRHEPKPTPAPRQRRAKGLPDSLVSHRRLPPAGQDTHAVSAGSMPAQFPALSPWVRLPLDPPVDRQPLNQTLSRSPLRKCLRHRAFSP